MEGTGRTGAEGRAKVEGAEVGGAWSTEGDGASDLLALDFSVPGKVAVSA